MFQKWEYRIMARIKGRDYLIWKYPRHFHDDEKLLSAKGKKLLKKKGFRDVAAFEGTAHSNTAVEWILGIYRDMKKFNSEDHMGHQMMKGGMFNPHYRLSNDTYPDKWFDPKEVNKIFFDMSLIEVEEK